jgi:phosphatidate cytidylyltransferase
MMQDIFNNAATALGLPINIVRAGALVTGLLAVGSVYRWIRLRGADAAKREKRLGSLLVWWGMLAVVVFTLLAGKVGGVITFGTLSWLGLTEYFRMLDKKSIDKRGRWIVLLGVLVMYASVIWTSGVLAVVAALVGMIMGITIRLVTGSKTTGFLESASTLVWGSVVFAFFLCHAAMLLALPGTTNPVAGPAGWFVFLIFFTECNDIFQAISGRRWGRRKITPDISPNKTWEGFLIGGLTTIVLGCLLAPLITPLARPFPIELGNRLVQVPYLGAVLAGILLCVAGFFGDLNESALKRDAGVKDSGDWLPSQGGILDRIDSLTFTAPAFYYFVVLFYG